MLRGKKILLGICGSIAAYKAAFLIRLIKKEGAEVQVIATRSAHDFVTALTLSTVSENPVLTEFVANQEGEWNNHVNLGLWADLFLIAPASANTIAKMAHGQCDNLLLATYLSARCPVFVAPAMDLDMLQHPSTLKNVNDIRDHGVHVIDPEHGELASGLVGKGRMAEPEQIFEILEVHFQSDQPLRGMTVLVTAGPTYEKIDPVRFIGNFSSGRMGVAISQRLRDLGAKVNLVLGPVSREYDLSGLEVVHVTSAEEMLKAAQIIFPSSDIAVLAAAVADYKPVRASDQKIKRNIDEMSIELTANPDIAASLGKVKKKNQVVVGFALETQDEIENAKSKLKSKNFDFIVLNSLNDNGAGFGHETNQISIIDKGNNVRQFELKRKDEVAKDIVNTIITEIRSRAK